MKKIKFLLLVLIMFIPTMIVNAGDYDFLPRSISANDGTITFELEEDNYVAYVNGGVNEVVLSLPEINGITISGPNKFILNGGDTVVYYNFINSSFTDVSAAIPFTVHQERETTSKLGLEELQVVGYNFSKRKGNNEFTVVVPSNVKSVYVHATPKANDVKLTGTGIVKLEEKTTKVELITSNNYLGEETFTVIIVKKNYVLTYASIILAIVAVIALVLFILNRKNRKTITADSLGETKMNETDVSKIIKHVEETIEEVPTNQEENKTA